MFLAKVKPASARPAPSRRVRQSRSVNLSIIIVVYHLSGFKIICLSFRFGFHLFVFFLYAIIAQTVVNGIK